MIAEAGAVARSCGLMRAAGELAGVVPSRGWPVTSSGALRPAEALALRRSRAYWRARAGDVQGSRDDYAALLDDAERLLGASHPFTRVVRAEAAG